MPAKTDRPSAVESRRDRGAVIIALLVLCFILMGSAARGATARGSYDWWWVFYERGQGEHDTHFTVRPFYLVNERKNGNRFYASLIPIVYWADESPGNFEWRSLFGFVHAVDFRHANGVPDYDFGAFPFVYYGNSTDERDRYLMIWPFGGTLKGKLAQDRITTYLFPGVLLFFLYPPALPPTLISAAILIASFFPLYVDYQSRDYKAWGILWPFIQSGSGNGRSDFRVLPFYAHNSKPGFYDNRMWMLLLNYQRVFLKNDDEQRTFFFVPFFGRRWNLSDRAGSCTLLWPFFSWGFDKKAGSLEINFPWPLVQLLDSENPPASRRIFFPFFGTYRYKERESLFVTPLYFSMSTRTPAFTSDYYIGMIIIWYFKRDYLDQPSPLYGTHWRYFKIWPLFQYEHDDRGNLSFNMLSLLPWRDPDGYERLYQPFWTLLEYSRFQSGERRLGLLLRLYFQRWGENFIFIKVPLLFSYGRENHRLTEFSLLLSMFAYYNDEDGRKLRLFWIPIPLPGAGTPAPVARREAAVTTAFMDYSDTAFSQCDVTVTPGAARGGMTFHTARVF